MPGYYTVDYIYPVGFCSTRLYFSISKTSQMCLYTCKVSDSGTAAKVIFICISYFYRITDFIVQTIYKSLMDRIIAWLG